jgi:hypothetical protein
MRQQFKVVSGKKKRSGRLQEVALFDESGDPFTPSLPSARLSSSDGLATQLIHGLDWTPFIFDQGSVSNEDLFTLNEDGIEVSKPGSYFVNLGLTVNNPQRAGANTRIALQAFVPDPFGDAIAGTVVDAFNGWITYNVTALLEVGDDPKVVQPCYELLGATTDVTNDVWPWLAIVRQGAPVARPADTLLA